MDASVDDREGRGASEPEITGAESPRGRRPNKTEAPKARGAKVRTDGAHRGPERHAVKLSLDADVYDRLGVHAHLTRQDMGQVVSKVLRDYLARYGKGRELFAAPEIPGTTPGDLPGSL